MPEAKITDRVLHGTTNSPLPPSVEAAYYRKCIELKRRIEEIESNNDRYRTSINRHQQAITRLRLERAFLINTIYKQTNRKRPRGEESSDSESIPPTPQEKPRSTKRPAKKSANNANSSPAPPATTAPTGSASNTPIPVTEPTNNETPAANSTSETQNSTVQPTASTPEQSRTLPPPSSTAEGSQSATDQPAADGAGVMAPGPTIYNTIEGSGSIPGTAIFRTYGPPHQSGSAATVNGTPKTNGTGPHVKTEGSDNDVEMADASTAGAAGVEADAPADGAGRP